MSATEKRLSIHNFYLKNMVFDAPNSPTSFSGDGKRQMDFHIDIKKNLLSAEHNLHEVELHIGITTTMGVDAEAGEPIKVVLEMSFVQGGAFYLKGYAGDELDHILSTTCAGMVLPFALDVLSSTAYKIGFPQLVIPPIDFEELYQENKKATNFTQP